MIKKTTLPSPLSPGQLGSQTQVSRGALRLDEKHGLVDAETFSPAAVRATLHEKINEVEDRIVHLQRFKRFMLQVAKPRKLRGTELKEYQILADQTNWSEKYRHQ